MTSYCPKCHKENEDIPCIWCGYDYGEYGTAGIKLKELEGLE